MTATYLMQARENFDPTNQALVDGGAVNTPPYNQLSNTDNQVVGTAFDFARGKIMYVAFNGLSTDGYLGDYFNLTPYTLWDGFNEYPSGGALNLYNNLSPYIGEKDVTTDAVKWYPTYDPTKTVPTTVSPASQFGTGVYSIILTANGSGYTHASVVFSGGVGSTPTATAAVGVNDVVTYAYPDASVALNAYFAVVGNGQPWMPSRYVSQSAYPYTDGSYSVVFDNGGGLSLQTNIGPISYTAQVATDGSGRTPTVTITDFGLAGGGVTYVTTLVSGTVYQVAITQAFTGEVVNLTLTSGGTGTGWSMAITGDGTGATGIAYTRTATTLPAGCRRIGRDYAPSGGNNPVFVNPRNSDIFVHAESCELYQYRYADNFAQVISPYLYLSGSDPAASPMVRMFGLDTTWTYNIVTQQPQPGTMIALVIIPTAITADEVTYDSKLAYAVYTDSAATFLDDKGVRTVLGTDDALYLLSLYTNDGSELVYRLTQFTPPPFSTYIPGSNIAGGTFTDVTPWDSTHGPNSDGVNYGTSHVPKPSWFSYLSLFRLPASLNEAVGICKFLKEQSTVDTSDYANTIISAVNLKLGASPSFDYHSAFVTGYMNANWTTAGSIPVTGYAVLNYRELDIYLDQTDYVYPAKTGVFSGDYSKRWLYFDVYPIVGSTVITAGGPKIIMVQYQFAYGSAPAVVTIASVPQVIPEDGWDTTYAAYGTAIGKTFVVENSLYQDQVISDAGYCGLFRDAGITLGTDTAPIWWWSGQVDPNQDAASNNMFALNPMFSARAALNPPTNAGPIITPIDAPFLRLTYNPSGGGGGGGSAARGSQGHVY